MSELRHLGKGGRREEGRREREASVVDTAAACAPRPLSALLSPPNSLRGEVEKVGARRHAGSNLRDVVLHGLAGQRGLEGTKGREGREGHERVGARRGVRGGEMHPPCPLRPPSSPSFTWHADPSWVGHSGGSKPGLEQEMEGQTGMT